MSKNSYSAQIELHGHIIDSLILPHAFDAIMADGVSNFEVEDFTIGRHKTDPSYARINVSSPDRARLDELLDELRTMGAEIVEDPPAEFVPAEMDGVFPENFYATTNFQTFVRLDNDWQQVDRTEMDCGIRLDPKTKTASCTPMHWVKKSLVVMVTR